MLRRLIRKIRSKILVFFGLRYVEDLWRENANLIVENAELRKRLAQHRENSNGLD